MIHDSLSFTQQIRWRDRDCYLPVIATYRLDHPVDGDRFLREMETLCNEIFHNQGWLRSSRLGPLWSFSKEDLTAWDETTAAERMAIRIHESRVIPFHLNEGPVVRANLLYMRESALLLLSFHPLVADAPSVRRLMTAWTAGLQQDDTHRLQRPLIQPAMPDGQVKERTRPLRKPGSFEPSPVYTFSFPPSVVARIQTLCQSIDCSPVDLVCGVYAGWLTRMMAKGEEGLAISWAGGIDAHSIGAHTVLLPFSHQLSGSTVIDYATQAAYLRSLKCNNHPTIENLPSVFSIFEWDRRESGSHACLEVMADYNHFHTRLRVTEQPDGTWVGGLQRNLRAVTDRSEERLSQRFVSFLEKAVDFLDQPIHRIPLADAIDWKCLKEWNDTANAEPFAFVHRLIEEQASIRSNQTALVFQGETLSYGELNARANHLAHQLLSVGVGPEVPVAICLERSFDLVVAVLGVLKAGGCYVPLDPTYPAERLRFMLEECDALVLLTHTKGSQKAFASNPSIRYNLDKWQWEGGKSNPDVKLTRQHPCYIIYTSGSTGKPKGVVNLHQGLFNRLKWMQDTFQLSTHDAVLQKTPFGFDVSVWELLWPLMTGARMVIAKPEGHKDPRYLAEVIRDEAVTTLHFVPSMLHAYLEEPTAGNVPSLKRVICSGEALPPDVQSRFFRIMNCELHNLYGPTEASIDVTHWICRKDDAATSVPIGQAIDNTAIYILDDWLNPVPVGKVGEIYIGGIGLARHYLNRPAWTAAQFIPNPFDQTAGSRLYRTGDRARYTESGYIEYHGRLDSQIKMRGFRIELGEVEAVLGRLPEVKEAAVLVQRLGEEAIGIVGYVVPAAKDVTTFSLKNRLRAQLPSHMIPAQIHLLKKMPLTPNGKLDRKALSRHTGVACHKAGTPPQGPVEKELAAIWSTLLGVDPVNREDSFFELGGHSLAVTRLIARIRDRFGVQLSVEEGFLAPTLADWAVLINRRKKGTAEEQKPIIPGGNRSILSLSSAQRRIWFLYKLIPDSPLYNITQRLKWVGSLDRDALQRALVQLIQKHEMIRTTFVEEEGQPFMKVNTDSPIDIINHDLTHEQKEAIVAKAEAIADQEARKPFCLEKGPLMRIRLVRLAPEEHWLIVTFHHILSDGWSTQLWIRDLFTFYQQDVAETSDTGESISYQYADYIDWQNDQMEAVCERGLPFWKEKLAGELPALKLPADFPPSPQRTFAGAVYRFRLPNEGLQLLRSLCLQSGATEFMGLLAVYSVWLHRYSGQSDILIGTPVAGRDRQEWESLIGMFVNTLVLRTRVDGREAFCDILARTKTDVLQAMEHRDVPFEKVVEAVLPDRSQAHSPLYQVMFAYQNVPQLLKNRSPLIVEPPMEWHNGTAKFDLTLFIEEGSDGLEARWEYSTEWFQAETIQRMTKHFLSVWHEVVSQPEQPVGFAPMLLHEEWQELEAERARTQAILSDRCLHQLFEAQVQQNPARPAAVMGDNRMTYEELDQRGNRLAWVLQKEYGVGPGVPVGVCMDRSFDLLVALMGVLKAGGAYLPLDTDAPSARLAEVMQDAKAVICLMHEERKTLHPQPDIQAVSFEALSERSNEYPDYAPASGVTSGDLVSIYYTSGSTGKPKGVASTHQGWVNRMVWMQESYPLKTGETVLQKTTLTFDDSAVEIFWPLAVGGCVALMEPLLHKDPKAIVEDIRRYQPVVVQFVPSMLTLFLDVIRPEHRPFLRCLKHVISSGEALRSELVRAFREKVGCPLHNQWGATEVSIDSTVHTCTDSDTRQDAVVPIGKAIRNNEVLVLDKYLQPVPVGVVGDLYLAGVGLAQSYLNNPRRTAESFIPHPWVEGARMYKTGDRGYRRKDHSFVYLGRMDGQVKIRGQRVELAEIEAVLMTHPDVKDCGVVVAKRGNDAMIVAYVASDDSVPNHSSYHDFLSERLPTYMVPSRFVLLPTLPYTSSGKLDRKQLPDPGGARPDEMGSYQAPRNETEQRMVAIWEDILGIDPIGVYDRFFLLGGHSLDAVRTVARISSDLGVNIPLKVFFERGTIDGLMRWLQQEEKVASPATAGTRIPRHPGRVRCEMSHAQKRLWLEYQLSPDQATGFTFVDEIDGKLDVAAFLQAYEELSRIHGIMRTHFRQVDGLAVQEVCDATISCAFVNLEGEPEFDTILSEHIRAQMEKPFDLHEETGYRAMLVRQAPDRHLMVRTVHPIAYDGWSTHVFMTDLKERYESIQAGNRLEPNFQPPLQYMDYTLWQYHELSTGSFARQREYWLQKLNGYQPVEWAGEASNDPENEPGEMRFTVPPHEVKNLHALSVAQGTTLFVTLLSVWKMWMASVTGQTDITVGSPFSGRSHPELESVLGLLVNPVVLRTDLSKNPTVIDVMDRLKETTLEAFENQDYPYDLLIQELRSRYGFSQPLYQVVFVMQNAHQNVVRMGEAVYRHVPIEKHAVNNRRNGLAEKQTPFDLHIEVFEEGEAFSIRVKYHPGRYAGQQVREWMEQYLSLLSQVTQNPQMRLSELKWFQTVEVDDLFSFEP